MRPIGFSTGCLYKTHIPIKRRIKMFKELGADAVELSFMQKKELFEFEPFPIDFKFVSVHCPSIGHTYSNSNSSVMRKIKEICSKINVDALVMHPDKVENFGIFKELPFVFENMDSRKKYGTLEQIKELRKKGLKFMIDLQHVYEYDPSMKLAYKMIKEMQDVSHMHVSGCTKTETHSALFKADNREKIAQTAKKINLPIILEGVLTPDELQYEIEYVRSIF